MPSSPWGNCAAGCGLPPRSLAEIKADWAKAVARVEQHSQVAALRAANTTPPEDLERNERVLLAAYTTRVQLELNGYCQTCALRGQLKALETGPFPRTAHA